MKLRALHKRDRQQAINLLEKDKEANLFQLDSIDSRAFSGWYQDQWWGVFQNKQLLGVGGCFGRPSHGYPARLVVPYGEATAMKLLGQFERDRGGSHMVIGERDSADSFLQGMKPPSYQTFYNQRIFVCSKVHPSDGNGALTFQRAQLKHETDIYEMSAQMMLEDLGKDPRKPSPTQYRETIRRRIQEGRCFIGLYKQEIAFILDLGTNCIRGCQIGGTYVPPKFRGRGFATQGVHFWTERLIQKFGMVTLHVNEENIPAIRCYKRVGFLQSSPYRLAIIANLG